MTYKNIKFQDSPVMRSLEKLAFQKGLVKNDPVIKTASIKKSSLIPTENFEENVLKLCSALRDSGFLKEAVEVETKFFALKKAQSVHNETGEDLINQAHPDGSHVMKNMEGDAIIETILDAQKAAKNMIAKTPNGKFAEMKDLADIVKSSSKFKKEDAVNTIKIILGQAGGVGFHEVSLSTGGAFSKLMNLFRGGGSLELAGGATGTAGGEAASTAGGAVGGAAVASVVGAALVGAVAGAIAGNALFDKYLAPSELKEAGQKLEEKCKELYNDLNTNAKNDIDQFKVNFADILSNYGAIAYCSKEPTPESFASVKKLDELINSAHKNALHIWQAASTTQDDSFLGRLNIFSHMGDLVALAKNYMDISNDISRLINKFFQDTYSIINKKMSEAVNAAGGSNVLQLISSYKEAIKAIDIKRNVVNTTKPKNYEATIKWLDKAQNMLKSNLSAYENNSDKSNSEIYKMFQNKFNAINAKLKEASVY